MTANNQNAKLDAGITEYSNEMRIVTTIPQPVPDDETQCEWIVYGPMKAKVLNAPGYPPKPSRSGLYEVRSTPDIGCLRQTQHQARRSHPRRTSAPRRTPWDEGVVERSHSQPRQIKQVVMFEYESLLESTIARLSSESQADFRALHNAHTADGSGPLLGIIRTNCYGLDLYDGSEKSANGRYGTICKIGSRINHDCKPNVGFSIPTLQSTIRSQSDKLVSRRMASYANARLASMPPLKLIN